MKRIICFVEGQGDVQAVPVLLGRILTEISAWDAVFLDAPLRVGHPHKLAKNDFKAWREYLLHAVNSRADVGGVLYLADGDLDEFLGDEFCAAKCAMEFAEKAREAGAEAQFSVAVVFACLEFKSWLIAGVESLSGKSLPDGREGVEVGTQLPEFHPENSHRGAKAWLNKAMSNGYKETRDQAALTRLVDLSKIRNRPMRSFLRLDSAVSQLVKAIREEKHIVSPIFA